MTTVCSRPRCTSKVETRGMCSTHYRQRVHLGVYRLVDAAPVQAHLARLRELGWTWQQIADAAGLSSSTGHSRWVGRHERMRRETAEAILRIPAVRQRSHRGMDATGARRRVEALQWMGWPMREIATRLDVPAGTIPTLMYRGRLSARLVADIARVYEEMAHLPGPSKQSATKARRLGHASPWAWDADTIDDPRARPCGVRREAS